MFEAPWGFSLEETVAKVETGADAVLADIGAYAQKELSDDIVNLLLKHGLSLDVALQCAVSGDQPVRRLAGMWSSSVQLGTGW